MNGGHHVNRPAQAEMFWYQRLQGCALGSAVPSSNRCPQRPHGQVAAAAFVSRECAEGREPHSAAGRANPRAVHACAAHQRYPPAGGRAGSEAGKGVVQHDRLPGDAGAAQHPPQPSVIDGQVGAGQAVHPQRQVEIIRVEASRD